MKKQLGILLAFVGLFGGWSFANEYDDAVKRMHQEWLTIHSTAQAYKLDGNLRRDEAAKLFVKFLSLQTGTKLENGFIVPESCEFQDLDKARSDLKDSIKSACFQWIILWKNGKFSPDQTLTKAQGITILMRILEGKQSEPNPKEWWLNYYKLARKKKLLTTEQRNNPTAPMKRGELALLLYKAWNLQWRWAQSLSSNVKPQLLTGETNNQNSLSLTWKSLPVNTCSELPKSLNTCSQYACETNDKGLGMKMHFSVSPLSSWKCSFSEELPEPSLSAKIDCILDEKQQKQLALYWEKYLKSSWNFSTSATVGTSGTHISETIDGELVENPMNAWISNQVCQYTFTGSDIEHSNTKTSDNVPFCDEITDQTSQCKQR